MCMIIEYKRKKNTLRLIIIIGLAVIAAAVQIENVKLNEKANFNENGLEDMTQSSNTHGLHKAICTVTVGDVRASAEAATTTSPLGGDCPSLSQELKNQFDDLQHLLYKELDEMKKLLLATQRNNCSCRCLDENKKNDAEPFTHKQQTQLKSGATGLVLRKSVAAKHIKDKQIVTEESLGNELKFYTYRWKFEGFSSHVNNHSKAEIESDEFLVADRVLKMKLFFRYLQREYLYLKLVQLAVASYSSKRITLDIREGTFFKQISTNNNNNNNNNNNYQFKYKISVLDQSNQKHPNLVSQLFTSFDMGFSVPLSALIGSSYVRQNSLLIKIHFYI